MVEHNAFTLPSLLGRSVREFGDNPALSFVGETPLTYSEVGKKVSALVSFFEKLGIRPGDKVAILSQNAPNWGITYFAITTMGAVVVPLLPDFTPVEIFNVLKHSETSAIIVSNKLIHKLSENDSPFLKHIILLDDFSVIETPVKEVIFTENASPENEYKIRESDLAAIIYTSGTTGKQKGVMLSHKNISFNAYQGGTVQPIGPSDVFLSILPLSHTYENTLGLVLAVLKGACVYYLNHPVSPSVIAEALEKVRPTLILTVPMIIEKMYRSKILPGLRQNRLVWSLYHIPSVRKIINKTAGKKLMAAFGGRVIFFGIGGAKLDPTVEQFLLEARFPVAIGYGLTETSPLLAGTNPRTARFQSTGPAIEGVTLKLNLRDPQDEEGEIWAKGDNIMMGYYKDPNLTAEVITPDGWFRTGDLGAFDKDGFLSIKGRLKNTILGANGENIYPEEIESVINNFHHVIESVVVEKKGKLVALVYFNREEIEKACRLMVGEMSEKVEIRIEELKQELQKYVNTRVNKFSRLHAVVIHNDPFQKTATQKIKRYLYF